MNKNKKLKAYIEKTDVLHQFEELSGTIGRRFLAVEDTDMKE